MRVFPLLSAVLSLGLSLTLPFLPAAALVASADEGSPVAPATASPRIRPPMGVLRHVDAPTIFASVPSTAASTRSNELVVLVGGYQSCACPDDGTFSVLTTRLTAAGFDVVRFGTDPRFPYDTYGLIEPSAVNLRDEIRSLSGQYEAVHLVAHSMGGVVADRAFANGLGRSDGVVSYVSWSAPHSGSDAARAMALTRAVSGGSADPFRESLLWINLEAHSDAVRDLALTHAVAPPPGVVRLDLREATDVLVTERDAHDPGVTSRVLTGAVEGHGGILTDPQAIDQTVRTITERRVPPDERSHVLTLAAAEGSRRIGGAILTLICIIAFAACFASIVGRTPVAARLADTLGTFFPRGKRRPCP